MGLFSKKTTVPATGFYAQPAAYRAAYGSTLDKINALASADNRGAFTPLAQTADETAGINAYRNGFAPTADSLQADISMLSNPFDSSVIGEMNRQAAGNNSLVNQAAGRAGQIGSNRSFLGTSDVEQNRLNNIGQFKQTQYNNAINQALTQLPTLRQNDAANLMNIGGFQRGLDTATKQAGYAEAGADQGLINGVQPVTGSPAYTVKTGTGLGSFLGAVAPIVGSAFGPLGAVIGGALGGYASGGGSLSGALQGGLSGGFGAGLGSGMGSGFSFGQNMGALQSTSAMGPYKGFFS